MATINRIACGLLFAGAAALGALAFRAADGRDVASTTAHVAHAAVADAASDQPKSAADDIQLFDLDATWRDQSGGELSLRQAARGRVSVVTMLYTNCAVACPRLVADLKRIEGMLSAEQRQGVTFVVASIDPARDTPERLAQWAADTDLDPNVWSLLTGTDDTVRELAAALGVRYTTLPGGEVAHSNRIVVVDAAGSPVHHQLGVGEAAGVTATAAAVLDALSSRASPPPRTAPSIASVRP